MKIEDIIKNSSAQISIEYNNSVIMPEHILLAILGIEDFRFCEYLDSKGINGDLVSNYIKDNKKECQYQTPVFDEETKRLIKYAKHLQKGSEYELESVVIALFAPQKENYAIIDYFFTVLENFDPVEIYKNLRSMIVADINISVNYDFFDFGDNITVESIKDYIMPREIETNKLVENLINSNNPYCVLVGEFGVGKTSIVYNLVKKIYAKKVNERLKNKRIIKVNDNILSINSKDVNREKIETMIDKCKNSDNILFFNNVYGKISMYNSLDNISHIIERLILNKISFILTITPMEYNKHIKDSSLGVYLNSTIVNVSQLSKKETLEILLRRKEGLEKDYGIEISDNCIGRIIALADKYLTTNNQLENQYFPLKAIDLMNLSVAKYIITYGVVSDNKSKLKNLENQYKSVELLVRKENEEKVNNLRQEIRLIKSNIEMQDKLDYNSIDMRVCERVDIQGKQIFLDFDSNRFVLLNKRFKDVEINQKAVDELYSHMISNKNNLTKRPIYSYLFLGTEDCGQNEVINIITKTLFNNSKNYISIDVRDFLIDRNDETHIIRELIDASNAMSVVNKVSSVPYSIFVIKNIDMIGDKTKDILVKILETGKITNTNGRECSFSSTIIIATMSYLGIGLSYEKENIKKLVEGNKYNQYMKDNANKRLGENFVDCFDKVIYFEPILRKEDISIVLKNQIMNLVNKLRTSNKIIKFTNNAIIYLLKKCETFNFTDGMNPIREYINKLYQSILLFIEDNNGENDNNIYIDVYENELKCYYK